MNPFAIADRSVIAGIMSVFDTTNTAVPQAVAAAHDHMKRIADQYGDGPTVSADALATAVLHALDAGNDPTTDAEVQAVVTAKALAANHNLPADIASPLLEALRGAVKENLASIVKAWRVPFEQAAADLGDAHAVLGPVDLTDTGTIVRRGTSATEAWTKAQAATEVVNTIATGWSHASTFVNRTVPRRQYKLLVIAHASPTEWLDLELDDADADAWHALGVGLTLRLATFDELRADVAAIEGERIRRVDAYAAAMHDRATGRLPAMRRSSPTVVS